MLATLHVTENAVSQLKTCFENNLLMSVIIGCYPHKSSSEAIVGI